MFWFRADPHKVWFRSPLSEMPRFKRSLGYQGPPLELVPRAKPKPALLHEGFAIASSVPSIPEDPSRGRTDGEALPYRRGDARLAMAAALEPSVCRRVLAEGVLAESTKGPVASRLKLWAALANRCGYTDPFYLSPDSIFTIMGALKRGGYRSAQLYLEAAQAQHIASGLPWTAALQQARRAAIRSCGRYLGNPKQAGGLPLVRVAECTSTVPLVSGGPKWPGRAVLLASWWLLREKEAAQAKRMHIRLDEHAKTISWRLPSSKTDQAALGAVRVHSCSCTIGRSPICPYHLMVDQLQAIEADPLAPIFPTGGGASATKIGWADTFQAIAAELGIPLHHPNGARIFTGHSARVTGARHLASTNVELWRIQLFGRWGSSVFLHYIQDAPNVQMQTLALESSASLSIQQAQAQLGSLLRQIEDIKPQVARVQADMEHDCEAALGEIAPVSGSEPWVLNTSHAGKLHRALVWDKSINPKSWRTRCGWNFASHSADYTMYESHLGGPQHVPKCLKCFPERKASVESSDTNTTSDSSSDSSA